MKIAVSLASLLVSFISAAAFAGPISSNGPIGMELLHCEADVQISGQQTRMYLSVYPQMGVRGLVGRVTFDNQSLTPLYRSVQRIDTDPRGTVYQEIGTPRLLNIVIPNMQQPGQHTGLVFIRTLSPNAIPMACQENS